MVNLICTWPSQDVLSFLSEPKITKLIQISLLNLLASQNIMKFAEDQYCFVNVGRVAGKVMFTETRRVFVRLMTLD